MPASAPGRQPGVTSNHVSTAVLRAGPPRLITVRVVPARAPDRSVIRASRHVPRAERCRLAGRNNHYDNSLGGYPGRRGTRPGGSVGPWARRFRGLGSGGLSCTGTLRSSATVTRPPGRRRGRITSSLRVRPGPRPSSGSYGLRYSLVKRGQS